MDEEKLAIYAYFHWPNHPYIVGIGYKQLKKHAYVIYEWSPPYISAGFFQSVRKTPICFLREHGVQGQVHDLTQVFFWQDTILCWICVRCLLLVVDDKSC